jgi:hypothetical protein
MEFSKEDIDAVLNLLAWAGAVSGVLWLVTSLVGAAHRRTYNLTHADSGRAHGPTPDFLSPDAAKRRAALARGQAFDDALSVRDAVAAPAGAVEQASWWARAAALSTAVLTLLTAIVGTITKVDVIDAGIQRVGSVERFLDIVNRHKAGAAVAFAIIGTHLVVFVKSQKKTAAGK